MPGLVNLDLKGAGEIVTAVGGLAGQIRSAITGDLSPEAKARIEEAAHAAELARDIAQAKINEAEAAGGWFRSGWRPMIGWVGALAMAAQYLVRPILGACGVEMPSLDDSTLWTLIAGMLGLGGMRTMERVKGKA